MMALVVFPPSLVQPTHIELPLALKLPLFGKDRRGTHGGPLAQLLPYSPGGSFLYRFQDPRADGQVIVISSSHGNLKARGDQVWLRLKAFPAVPRV